jgi:ectoine hydroxylase-related dioxygenase (phytanoyl-CoA dioxygenase family)
VQRQRSDGARSGEALQHLVTSEAENLRKFAEDGYVVISLEVSANDAAQFNDDVNRLWREKPRNIAYAYDSPPRRMSASVENEHRRPRYRIHDMHSASETARRLYLDRMLLRYAALILEQPAVATQSLYFEFGSQQALHRDSIVVPTPIFGELLAAWIALEDIDERSGPLEFVPGSHKLPMYEFRPGQYMYDASTMGEAEVRAAMQFHEEESAKRGLTPKRFIARRGQALIWHSALLHGGATVADESLTRKSFVVHYSTLRNHPARSITLQDNGRSEVWTTRETIERDGARGFANPLDGALEYVRA